VAVAHPTRRSKLVQAREGIDAARGAEDARETEPPDELSNARAFGRRAKSQPFSVPAPTLCKPSQRTGAARRSALQELAPVEIRVIEAR